MTASPTLTACCILASVILTAIGVWAALRSGSAVISTTDANAAEPQPVTEPLGNTSPSASSTSTTRTKPQSATQRAVHVALVSLSDTPRSSE